MLCWYATTRTSASICAVCCQRCRWIAVKIVCITVVEWVTSAKLGSFSGCAAEAHASNASISRRLSLIKSHVPVTDRRPMSNNTEHRVTPHCPGHINLIEITIFIARVWPVSWHFILTLLQLLILRTWALLYNKHNNNNNLHRRWLFSSGAWRLICLDNHSADNWFCYLSLKLCLRQDKYCR